MPRRLLRVDPTARGLRLDQYLSQLSEMPTRSQFHQRGVAVFTQGKELKFSYRLKGHEELLVQWEEERTLALEPVAMELDVLYEDEATLVLNKPRGISVHPGAGQQVPTLVHGILAHLQEPIDRWQEPTRPGIVHRLDKDTTGVLLCAKNTQALEYYASQFRKRTVKKIYLALVRGKPPQSSGLIETLLARDPHHRRRFRVSSDDGKRAITGYQVLATNSTASLLRLNLYTGRTHQIRVHLAHLGCPIFGDHLYARKAEGDLLLHAFRLQVNLYHGGSAVFEAPLPQDFIKRIEQVGLGAGLSAIG
jgi:23S rRNA pseudouridine1911/1915/1917 synthase